MQKTDEPKLEVIRKVFSISDTSEGNVLEKIAGIPVFTSEEAANQYTKGKIIPQKINVRSYQTRPGYGFDDEINKNAPIPEGFERIGSIQAVKRDEVLQVYLFNKQDVDTYERLRTKNNITTILVPVFDLKEKLAEEE